jgi:hypothetical protein
MTAHRIAYRVALLLLCVCIDAALQPAAARAQSPNATPRDLTVVSVGWTVIGQDILTAFLFENPNPDFAALGPRFRVVVYDASGTAVATQDISLIAPLVLPGERRGVPPADRALRLPRAGIRVTRVEVQVREQTAWIPTGTLPLLRVEDARYTPPVGASSTGTASGTVVNPFDRELSEVYVSALAFDPEGNIVGGGRTIVPRLPAEGTALATVPLTTYGVPATVALYAAYPGEEPPRVDFAAFATSWDRHGFHLTVESDGQASAAWRVYRWCHLGEPPPCDWIDEERGYITGGGQATIVFRRVEWPVAYGEVLDTTQPEVLARGPVTLTLLPYGMARLTQGSRQVVLCGPDYAELAPEAVRRLFPCGA